MNCSNDHNSSVNVTIHPNDLLILKSLKFKNNELFDWEKTGVNSLNLTTQGNIAFYIIHVL